MSNAMMKVIIEGESNPLHFENFCIELFTRVEGRTFVPTSKNYDRGRDARTTRTGTGSHEAILAASLSDDIDDKILADVTRIAKTTQPDRIIYCAKQPLTEDKIDKIVVHLHKAIPGLKSASAFGSIQIARLSENHAGIFDHFYELEKRNIENRLNAFLQPQQTADTKGLRLALIAFGSENAVALRCELLKRVILEALFEMGPSTVEGISTAISESLKLQLQLNREYIKQRSIRSGEK
jgi:hypothetical protein